MNIYNKFIEELEYKNRIKNILNYDLRDKLLSNRVRNKSLNSLLSTRPDLKENINKIKMKYGYFEDSVARQEILHNKISQLKNKYKKYNSNYYTINSVNAISFVNKKESKEKETKNYNKTFNHKTHSVDFGRIKYSSFPNNQNNLNDEENEKINNNLSYSRLMEGNNRKIDLNMSDNTDNPNIKGKNINDLKFVKNNRSEYNKIEQKIKEILKNEYLNPEERKKYNNIYPISKRINMLSDIKKEINNINQSNDRHNNSFLSHTSSGSYTTLGFNFIQPKVKRLSIYDTVFNDIIDSKNQFENSKNNEIEKPVIIKLLNRPNFSPRRFSSFFKMDN